jgi:hypothetical protein
MANQDYPYAGTGQFWVMADNSVKYEQVPFIFWKSEP